MKLDLLTGGAIVALITGIVSSIVALRKLKPESDALVVQSAKVVLTMSTETLEREVKRHALEVTELRQEMVDLREQIRTQSREATLAVAEARSEARELRRERDSLKADNWELRSRIEVLEAEVAELRTASGPHPIVPPQEEQSP